MPFISARVISVIRIDTPQNLADAGANQSVLCAATVFLQGDIIPGPVEDHTFVWEQTFGTPVTLINPNTLTPSFVNPLVSDIEFTLYVDRNTPFEDSDTVFISRRPEATPLGFIGTESTTSPSGTVAPEFASITTTFLTLADATVTGSAFTDPPARYSPIYTTEDLDRVRNNLSGSYMLMNDLDFATDFSIDSALRENWNPIGTFIRPFTGTFDGNGYVIDNMTITNRVFSVGLFSVLNNGALIENLGVTNASVTGQTSSFYSSILAGSLNGPVSDDGGPVTIRNCYTTGTIDGEGDRAGGFIGITGANAGSIFENTYADVTITGGIGTRVGGWTGIFLNDGTYTENYGNTDKTTPVHGTVGDVAGSTEVEGRTTAQLNVEANYTGWDFTDRWEIVEGVSPAALQDKSTNRIRRGGFCDDQWMIIWDAPSEPRFGITPEQYAPPPYIYKGAIIEERVGTDWGFPRFIPTQQHTAPLTPDVAHRLTSVWRHAARGQQPKEINVINKGTFISKNTSPRFGPYGNTAFATARGGLGLSDNFSITISNPRKISKLTLDNFNSTSGAIATVTVITAPIFRTHGTVDEFEDIHAYSFGGDSTVTDAVVITRNNGASIG